MENRELTKTRVRNIMNDMPTELKHRRMAKVRNTMKRTFSGMNTLLGQLAQSKTDKIRATKQRKKNISMLITVVLTIVIVVTLVVIFTR